MQTIFAHSSGKGKAGVAIIRISGAFADVKRCLETFGIEQNINPRQAYLKKLTHNSQTIDNALVIYFDAPKSFTGEDVIEFHLHGSLAVIEQVLQILSEIDGYRLAEAGEFSKRAFQNGKMDLLQAEGLADLIEAETKAQASQALSQAEGETSSIYENWRTRIIEIMAFIEAYVDFPDEDIPQDLDLQAIQKMESLIAEIESAINDETGLRLRAGVVATILGKPNVGKSSMLNYLAKKQVAIVSDIAGTTRDSIEHHFNISGYPLTIIDTAGIRESDDVIEQKGVEIALEKAKNADFKIIILSAEDADNKEILNLKNDDDIVIINKIDLDKTQTSNEVSISIKENINLDALHNSLLERLKKLINYNENPIVTRQRHKNFLKQTNASLQDFIASRKNNLPIEISAENLRTASHAIGKIQGKIGVEDILDKIFSEFCIGK